jgi:hypothetical protein
MTNESELETVMCECADAAEKQLRKRMSIYIRRNVYYQ